MSNSKAIQDVIDERQRQINVHGYVASHDDDENQIGQLAIAGACYAGNAGGFDWIGGWPGEIWPWDKAFWKPSTPRHDLVKAAALIIAEIERLDRKVDR